jgi:outer membrane protein assembly factor BamA
MKSFLLLLFVGCSLSLSAQLDYAVVEQVEVIGNSKTKERVILRELAFSPGDSIPLHQLSQKIERSQSLLMNTNLFSKVTITYQDWSGVNNHISIKVEVKEAWYIYPLPSFQLADRNFNVWWVDHNAALSRTNYGMDFTHLNTTGRGDRLKASFQLGYTQRYRLRYITRSLNEAQTMGLTVNFAYLQNREVNYATIENRQVFYQNNETINYHRFLGDISISFRPGLLETHDIRLGFRHNRINEVIAQELNPNFFMNGESTQRFALLEYFYQYDARDNRGYPMDGNYFSFSLEKDGLGFYQDRNALTSFLEYQQYLDLIGKFNIGLVSKAKYSFIRTPQPYNDNRAIGFFGNSLRGYEYYIIDGLDMVLLNTSIKHPIINQEINLGRLMPIASFRRIPFRLNFSINNDLGYVNNPFEKAVNPFNNRLLWGTGVGLDAIFFFDMVFRLEYSRNHLGESGIFLHFNSSI